MTCHPDSSRERCFYCDTRLRDNHQHEGKSAQKDWRTKDHVIPLSKGGVNIVYNRVWCCHECNQAKSDDIPGEGIINRIASAVSYEGGNKLYWYDEHLLGRLEDATWIMDPCERIVADALTAAEIDFIRDDTVWPHLDFYLPASELHIEVKQLHSDRIAKQMSRVTNVIAIQGIDACRTFAKMIGGTQ